MSPEYSFADFLQSVKYKVFNAYQHQELPFEYLVEKTQPLRSLNKNPLFQVMFVMQNMIMPTINFDELEISPINLETGTAKFDLTLSLKEFKEGYLASFEYSTDLFEENRIKRMLDHFARLLEAVLSNPDAPLVELDYLSEDERHLVLSAWNQTARRFAAGQGALTMSGSRHRIIRRRRQSSRARAGSVTRRCGKARRRSARGSAGGESNAGTSWRCRVNAGRS